jgi:hypothetical protein
MASFAAYFTPKCRKTDSQHPRTLSGQIKAITANLDSHRPTSFVKHDRKSEAVLPIKIFQQSSDMNTAFCPLLNGLREVYLQRSCVNYG